MALNDDYLKFLRWAVWKVVEQPGGARHGIVAFVTNHGFVNGRVHRGVRKALLDAFDEIYVFDLQGNQRLWVKGIVDEKVFPEVQQGVAMTVLVRRDIEKAGLARVLHRSMKGTRIAKYAAASAATLGDDAWTELTPTGPFWSFAPAGEASDYDLWPSVTTIFPVGVSGIQTQRDDLVSDSDRDALLRRIEALTDAKEPSAAVVARLGVPENSVWSFRQQRKDFASFDKARVVPWLYRLFDRRFLYWDPSMMGRARENVMRHLLKQPFGFGGEHRLALVIQRARPIGTIATVVRGPSTAHVTGEWCHIYPLRLSEATKDETWLPATDDWLENLDADLASRLAVAYGSRPTVDDVGWYVFAVLSAPSFRVRFAASLAIDHPRIPFPVSAAAFRYAAALGEELGGAHLLESAASSDIKFEGAGTNAIESVRYDQETERVWVNATQAFTGVPNDAWLWGGHFRPLEHFLDDRQGRRIDTEQIGAYQSAIHAVRECIRLGPTLDAALTDVLAGPLVFSGAESV